jgi:glycosyltransferase involved in cell wall biosynthesis
LLPTLRQANPDVLIVGGWDQIAYQLARAFRVGSNTRLLWWVESTLRDRRSEGATVRAMKRRLVSAGADIVVPGSASLAYVESLGADRSRIWVAPNAVDNAAFSDGPRAPKEPVGFLFVGRLESGKGLGTLLDAWTRSGGSVDLSIVGVGALETSIRRRIAETSMPPAKLLGHLEREELVDAYRNADVFVFPSVSDPWGLVVNEAMAAGLPVIASSAPGAVDDLVRDGDNGFVVPPFDASSLATAIDALSTDAELRARMGARSLDRIGSFTPDGWARGMRDAALSVAGRAA